MALMDVMMVDVEMSEATPATVEVPTITDSDVKMDVTTEVATAPVADGMELDSTDVDEEKKLLAIRQGAFVTLLLEKGRGVDLVRCLCSRVLLRRL